MDNPLTLNALFRFQDDAAAHNLSQSEHLRELVAYVEDSVALLADCLFSMHFPTHKQHALRVLGADAVTGIVSSVRAGLWGNLPEAAVLLRAALETISIVAAAVEAREYESLATELASARLRRHDYARSKAKLGDLGARIDRLRGRLSEVGAHSTGTRLKFSSYEIEGQLFDRVGAALDPTAAELALAMAPDVCLHFLDTCVKAYDQEGTPFPDRIRLSELRARFEECKGRAGRGEPTESDNQ